MAEFPTGVFSEHDGDTRLCPLRYARATRAQIDAFEALGEGETDDPAGPISCQTEACAAWRHWGLQGYWEKDKATGEEKRRLEAHGYCGLAGRPEAL